MSETFSPALNSDDFMIFGAIWIEPLSSVTICLLASRLSIAPEAVAVSAVETPPSKVAAAMEDKSAYRAALP